MPGIPPRDSDVIGLEYHCQTNLCNDKKVIDFNLVAPNPPTTSPPTDIGRRQKSCFVCQYSVIRSALDSSIIETIGNRNCLENLSGDDQQGISIITAGINDVCYSEWIGETDSENDEIEFITLNRGKLDRTTRTEPLKSDHPNRTTFNLTS